MLLTLYSYRLWLWDLEEIKEAPTPLLPDTCLVNRIGPTVPQGRRFELLCIRIMLWSTVPRATMAPQSLLALILRGSGEQGGLPLYRNLNSSEDSPARLIQCQLQTPVKFPPLECLFREGCILSATGPYPQMPAVPPHHDNCMMLPFPFPTAPSSLERVLPAEEEPCVLERG